MSNTHAHSDHPGGGRGAFRQPGPSELAPGSHCGVRSRSIRSFVPVTHDTSGQPFGLEQVSGHLGNALAIS